MKAFHRSVQHTIDTGQQLVIGRESDCDIVLSDSDRTISRRAAVLHFEDDAWVVQNTGRRTFHLVEPSGELEVAPTAATAKRRILHHHTWLRFPGATGDYGVVITVTDNELPAAPYVGSLHDVGETIEETAVRFTDNEMTSLRAIYEGYLRLPPHYTRRPNSFRSVAARLSVEEGKVKADHRRSIEKVIQAGGPSDAHANRDALVAWLLSRELLHFEGVDA